MAPLLPLITLTLSLFATPPVFAWNDDYNNPGGYGSPSYYAEQQRQQKMESYRPEEQAAQYRNEQAVRERNQPPTYASPSWTPSTHSFTFSNGNDPQDMKLCTASKYTVSCF